MAVKSIVEKANVDFILAMGNDTTDECMFKILPQKAIAIKVCPKETKAKYKLENVGRARHLLKNLLE